MRVLVVDESRMMPWLVARLGGVQIQVEAVDSFPAALAAVRGDGIDAAVVSLTPARLPWREFQRACASHDPPVPVLYESCVAASPGELGLEPLEGRALFLRKPAPLPVLAGALAALLAERSRSVA